MSYDNYRSMLLLWDEEGGLFWRSCTFSECFEWKFYRKIFTANCLTSASQSLKLWLIRNFFFSNSKVALWFITWIEQFECAWNWQLNGSNGSGLGQREWLKRIIKENGQWLVKRRAKEAQSKYTHCAHNSKFERLKLINGKFFFITCRPFSSSHNCRPCQFDG